MFKFTTEEIQKIKTIVEDEYSGQKEKKEVENGLLLLEKLINCRIENTMTEQTGQEIKARINLEGFEIGGSMEAVLKKLCVFGMEIKEAAPGCDRGLAMYYSKLGILDELNATWDEIWKTKGNSKKLYQVIHSYVAQERHNWPAHQLSYVYVWKYRNHKGHGNEFKSEERVIAQKSYFAVLIDICNRFADYISKRYKANLINSINFSGFKQKLHMENNRDIFFEKVFTPLHWGDNEIVWDINHRSIMLIGEAGAGKTTQMERLYWEELKSDEYALPVWINVQGLTENPKEGTDRLMDAIREKLGNYADWCEELMEQGLIKLYLDGLNELLVSDRGASCAKLISTIKTLLHKYPVLHICMTDRSAEYFTGEVTVYTCASMDEEDCREYCTKYWGEDEADRIMKFIDPEDPEKEWFWNSRDGIVTPEKVNGLAMMVLDGHFPKDKKDYYFKYLEHILKREQNEKNDNRIPTLKVLLHLLADKMVTSLDFKYGLDILDLFAGKLNNNIEIANEYFTLACRIPLITKYNEEKYGFVYYGYYEYFNRKDLI